MRVSDAAPAKHPMVSGTFVEAESDPHVAVRGALLREGASHPAPGVRTIPARAADFPDGAWPEVRGALEDSGLALVQLDEPLSADRFLALGRRLGTPMPETDPAVLPQVEEEVILNLVARYGHTRDVSLQPFATQHLTLHTESSGRPAAAQPRYIVLMCRDPGDASTTAQTVVVPMRDVVARMDPGEVEVLAGTRYAASEAGPFIARSVQGRRVFSFRDFHPQPLAWVSTSAEATEERVNGAIRSLLAAMYAPEGAAGITWSRGMLIVLDNTYAFHGRTAGSVSPARRPRHLQRLRILSPT